MKATKGEDWRNAPVEPNIRGLVDALNAVPGVRTRASCQGHVFPGSPPYVMFEAPIAFASALERRLREDALSPKPRLPTLWTVEGIFDGEFQLRFFLIAPEYKRRTKTLCMTFRKKRMIKDFDAIALFVSEIVNVSYGITRAI